MENLQRQYKQYKNTEPDQKKQADIDQGDLKKDLAVLSDTSSIKGLEKRNTYRKNSMKKEEGV